MSHILAGHFLVVLSLFVLCTVPRAFRAHLCCWNSRLSSSTERCFKIQAEFDSERKVLENISQQLASFLSHLLHEAELRRTKSCCCDMTTCASSYTQIVAGKYGRAQAKYIMTSVPREIAGLSTCRPSATHVTYGPHRGCRMKHCFESPASVNVSSSTSRMWPATLILTGV